MAPTPRVICKCPRCNGQAVPKTTYHRHRQAEHAKLQRKVSKKAARRMTDEMHLKAQAFLKTLAPPPLAAPAPQSPPPGGLEPELEEDINVDMDPGEAMPLQGIDTASRSLARQVAASDAPEGEGKGEGEIGEGGEGEAEGREGEEGESGGEESRGEGEAEERDDGDEEEEEEDELDDEAMLRMRALPDNLSTNDQRCFKAFKAKTEAHLSISQYDTLHKHFPQSFPPLSEVQRRVKALSE
ncbi:hypothetical protein CALVIDRAFT_569828, partial [Calocera viscosa TUFC12733]